MPKKTGGALKRTDKSSDSSVSTAAPDVEPAVDRRWWHRPFAVFRLLFAAGGVFALWWPFFHLYYYFRPALGIDLYLSVSLLTYLTKHSPFPWSGWKYIWYGGTPMNTTYPILGFWLMTPLKAFFSNVQTVQVFTLAAVFAFLVLLAVLVRYMSKSTVIGIVAAGAVGMSFNLYGGLFWGGSMPYMQTLWALPLTLYLAIRTLETGRRYFLAAAALACGLAALIHPLSLVAYTIPLTTWLILLWKDDRVKLFAREKLGHLAVFLGGIFLVGYPQFALSTSGGPVNVLLNTVKGLVVGSVQQLEQARGANLKAVQEVAGLPAWHLPEAYIWTNRALVVGTIAFAAAFLLVFLLRRAPGSWRRPIIFAIWALYFPIFLFTFVAGYNPFSGGWFRVFWAVPAGFAVLIGVFWGGIRENIRGFLSALLERSRTSRWTLRGLGFLATLVVAGIGIALIRLDAPRQVEKMIGYQQISSAFPVDLNEKLTKAEWPGELRSLAPAWLPVDDQNYRFYSGDATITIWWNSLFDMPQARGYLDSLAGGNYAGWQYLQNIALTKDELVMRLGFPENLAENTAKFFLDWHAIKYVEHGSGFGRNYPTGISQYLRDDFVREETLVFHERPRTFVQEGISWEVGAYDESLVYAEFPDELVSPIVQATNAPAIGIVSSKSGQDTLMRLFAMLNRNSRSVIPAYLGDSPGDLTAGDYARFDAVIVYDYELRPKDRAKAFAALASYVEGGGKLFLETGTDELESNAADLPEPFPFEAGDRKAKGTQWQLTAGATPLTDGVDHTAFSPAVFNGEPWSIASPSTSLRPGSEVVLSVADAPAIVRRAVGRGEVIWSGFNLPYHILQYVNSAELKLWANVLDALVKPSANPIVTDVDIERQKPERLRVTGQGAKAVLFKESRHPGWSAEVKVNGKTVRSALDEAGPMDPGYMYVRLPDDAVNQPFSVTFRYRGTFDSRFQWVVAGISTVLFALFVILPKRMGRIGARLAAAARGRMRGWWEKDEA